MSVVTHRCCITHCKFNCFIIFDDSPVIEFESIWNGLSVSQKLSCNFDWVEYDVLKSLNGCYVLNS